jgi:nicotinamidase-related amidase
MSANGTALLVIDVQESFRHRPYYREEEVAAYIERQQALIDGAKRKGIPVVQIFHVENEGPFSEACRFP